MHQNHINKSILVSRILLPLLLILLYNYQKLVSNNRSIISLVNKTQTLPKIDSSLCIVTYIIHYKYIYIKLNTKVLKLTKQYHFHFNSYQ